MPLSIKFRDVAQFDAIEEYGTIAHIQEMAGQSREAAGIVPFFNFNHKHRLIAP